MRSSAAESTSDSKFRVWISSFQTHGNRKYCKQTFALGRIIYSQVPEKVGYLLYIKASLKGSEPADLLSYAVMHGGFPLSRPQINGSRNPNLKVIANWGIGLVMKLSAVWQLHSIPGTLLGYDFMTPSAILPKTWRSVESEALVRTTS
jgi:hypothetical protein